MVSAIRNVLGEFGHPAAAGQRIERPEIAGWPAQQLLIARKFNPQRSCHEPTMQHNLSRHYLLYKELTSLNYTTSGKKVRCSERLLRRCSQKKSHEVAQLFRAENFIHPGRHDRDGERLSRLDLIRMHADFVAGCVAEDPALLRDGARYTNQASTVLQRESVGHIIGVNGGTGQCNIMQHRLIIPVNEMG